MARASTPRPNYLARLWSELGRIGGEHDPFIKVIIVERIVKAIVLTVLAIALLVAGRNGWLDSWANYAENQLNLDVGRGIIMQLLLKALGYVRTRATPRADLDRVVHQREFIGALTDKATSASTLLNPFRLFPLIVLGGLAYWAVLCARRAWLPP